MMNDSSSWSMVWMNIEAKTPPEAPSRSCRYSLSKGIVECLRLLGQPAMTDLVSNAPVGLQHI